MIHNGIYKLGDFGLAYFTKNVSESNQSKNAGSGIYKAPEENCAKPTKDSRIDVYSLGITLYNMMYDWKKYPP